MEDALVKAKTLDVTFDVALAGTPDATGKVDVAVTVTIDQEVRKLDDSRLGWCVEKAISTSIMRVGSATRRYSTEGSR
jgi:hypothetical protein